MSNSAEHLAETKIFRASDQRELAQQIAADLNGGRTLERHAEMAATVLTSDWLAARDARMKAEALAEQRIDAALAQAWDDGYYAPEGATNPYREGQNA